MDSLQITLNISVFIAVISFSCAVLDDVPSEISPREPYEYCSGEEFRPRCSSNEVVVINDAMYGRTSSGRCFADEEQQIGCSINFTEHLDSLCSGQRSCTVRLPNLEMNRVNPCPKSMKAALYASYRCIKVAGDACQAMCHVDGHAKVFGESGYLASVVTAETQGEEACGSSHCPWIIQVLPGQTIHITLLDYTVSQQQQQQRKVVPGQLQRLPGMPSERCSRLVIIKERANPKDNPVCGGKIKQRHLYNSVSNAVEVHFVSHDAASSYRGQFLMHYEAVGCPDVVPPKYSRMVRMHDRCEVDCPGTDQRWLLRCIDNEWVGDIGHCPVPPSLVSGNNDKQELKQKQSGFWSILSSLPLTVLITLVIALTIIIAVIIITTGIVCLKKNRYKARHRPDSAIYTGACSEFEFRQDLVGANSALMPKLMATSVTSTGSAAPSSKPRHPSGDFLMPVRDNTYAVDRCCMESRPLPAIPDASSPHSSNNHCVMVQVHPNSDAVNSSQVRPTIISRSAGTGHLVDDRRAPPPPPSSGHHVSAAPTALQTSNQSDNHHYFILDPDVLVEEPATPRSGQSLSYRSTESQTQTVSQPNNKSLEERDGCQIMAGQCNSSANGIQLRPIRDCSNSQKTNPQSSNSASCIGSWP